MIRKARFQGVSTSKQQFNDLGLPSRKTERNEVCLQV